MDDWDPKVDDYEDKSFNSYTRGPGRNLSLKKNYVKGAEKSVQLYVTGIPQELTEEGLENLFGRAGTVVKVKKLISKRENAQDTFGFITMANITDAEQAIAAFDGFRVNKFNLKVRVAMSKEELDRRKQQQDLNLMTARGFDDRSSDSDSLDKMQMEKPKITNGFGKPGAATGAIGVGRGKKLREMADVGPAGDAHSQMGAPSPYLGNLSVQVDKDYGYYNQSSHQNNATGGRGRSFGRGERMYDSDYEQCPSRGRGRKGRGYNPRGGRGGGYHPRGGRGGGYYQNYYDDYQGGYEGGYGGGYQPPPYMGRGMYMPTMYVDPYVGMMGTPHLLQPAVMNPAMMNNSMQQQMSMQQTPMPTPAARHPSTSTHETEVLRQECSVCGKLGVSRCSKCKVPYCSRSCQEKDWSQHKLVCGMMKKDIDTTDAFKDFEVDADENLIPQVKQLMEKVTGDTIQVTKKADFSPRSRSSTASSRADMRKDERRVQVKQSDDSRGQDRGQDRRAPEQKERVRPNDDRRNVRNVEDVNMKSRSVDKFSEKKEVNEKGCFNCGAKTHWRNDCPMPHNYNLECYNCRERGHMSKDCPAKAGKDEECYVCREIGHIARDCPQREDNKRRNNASDRMNGARPKTSSPKVEENFDDEDPFVSKNNTKPVMESTVRDVSKVATKRSSAPSPPPKKSLPVATMPLDTEITVVITVVEDPGHFYLQMALDQYTHQFKDLMVLMHQTYNDSNPDVNEVLPGEIYAVRFSEDGSWNRAKVVKVTGANILVQFLDFGNRETTSLENMRQLTNDMMKLAAQGVFGALHGILPKSGPSWNIANEQLNKYLTTDIPYHATCKQVLDTPTGKINEMVLTMIENGENVADRLVSEGLVKASSGAETQSVSQSVPQSREVSQTSSSQELLPVATMPLNEEIMIVITVVEDPGHFYIQMALEQYTHQFQDLMIVMHEKFNDSKPDVSEVSPGEIYAVRFSEDGSWNRAKVVKVTGANILVQFLDFGNKENTSVENMRQLTDEMKKVPAQGVLCALHGIVPKSGESWNIAEDQLNKCLITDIAYKAICKQVIDGQQGKLNLVDLTTMEGENVTQKLIASDLVRADTTGSAGGSRAMLSPRTAQGASASPEKSAKESPQTESVIMVRDVPKLVDSLSVGTEFPLMIPDMRSPGDFTAQILDEENIQQFTEYIAKFNEDCKKLATTEYRPVAVGELVASRFSQDADWYRAEVLEIVDDGANVLFIDYLNSEVVTFDMLRKAMPLCATFPVQGIACCLYGIKEPSNGQWPPQVLALFQTLTQTGLNGTVKGIIKGVVAVELKDMSGASVNDNVKSLMCKDVPVKKSTTAVKGKINQGEIPLDGSKVQAMVTSVSGFDQVYVQEMDPEMEKKRNEMMLGLNQSLSKVTDLESYEAEEGMFVAAVYDAGGTPMWYRGLVEVKVSENNFMILFVDYGNTECVPKGAIAPLELRFMSLPAMAVRCQLAGSEGVGDEQTLENLKSLTDHKMYVKAVDFVSGIFKVEMYLVDGTNVNEAFEFKNNPTKSVTKTPTKTVEETPPKKAVTSPEKPSNVELLEIAETTLPFDGTKIPSKVVLTESLANFYIHKVDTEIDTKFMDLLKEMQQYYSTDSQIYSPEVGEFVAALYDDGSGAVWYRAKVLHTLGNEVKVSIIDYGNVCFVGKECVRRLDKKFAELPAIAVKCMLNGSTGIETSDIIEEFKSCETTTVKVHAVSKNNDTYLVDLHLFDPVETSVASCLGLEIEPETKTPEKVPETPTSTSNNLSRSPATSGAKSPVSQITQNISVLTDLKLPSCTDIQAVSYVINTIRSFYIQPADEDSQKALATMMIELAEACLGDSKTHMSSAGEIVAALFEEGGDANWYRGQVLELIDSNECKVMFVDYGNTETVQFKDIRRLESRFLDLPRMAVHCCLFGAGEETDGMVQAFRAISNIPVTVHVISVENGTYQVEVITSDNRNINQELGLTINSPATSVTSKSPSTEIVDNLPKAISPSESRLPKKVTSPPKGERNPVFSQTLTKSRPQGKEFKAIITSVVRPNFFHCQVFPENDETTLQELQFLSETMQLECEASFEDLEKQDFEVGELCCAKFPVDSTWYRATVLEVFPDKTVKVEYVDFGNLTEVPITQLRPVTQDYTRLPLLAFRCSLHGIKPVGSGWTKESAEEMSKFQDKQLEARTICVNNDVYELELTDPVTNVNMAKHLVSVGLAVEEDFELDGMSEMERLKREKELLQKQLDSMQAKMAAIQREGKL